MLAQLIVGYLLVGSSLGIGVLLKLTSRLADSTGLQLDRQVRRAIWWAVLCFLFWPIILLGVGLLKLLRIRPFSAGKD